MDRCVAARHCWSWKVAGAGGVGHEHEEAGRRLVVVGAPREGLDSG